MEWKKDYSLLLLAGGRSRRMGQDKGQLLFQGKTFVEGLLEKGRQLGIGPAYLSGGGRKEANVQTVPDIYPDRGPLGGFHACMKAMAAPYCLVLPVDVPQIPLEILEELLNAHHEQEDAEIRNRPFILCHGGRKEPLIGIYPTALADLAGEIIREQGAKVFALLEKSGHTCYDVEVPEWMVDNINTPEAYEALLELEKYPSASRKFDGL